MLTRREFGRLALAALPGSVLLGSGGTSMTGFARSRPDSVIDGVQIGVITYSYRSMPDQSAAAVLDYVVRSGISAIELMGGPVESFAGAPEPVRSVSSRDGRSGSGRPGAARAADGARQANTRGVRTPVREGEAAGIAGSWKGEPCPAPQRPRTAQDDSRRRSEPTAAQQEHARKMTAWRTSISMDRFKQLRKMYNDAGVTIYAWKQLNPRMSDEEIEYVFDVAEALGCTHTTLELPADAGQLKRIGAFAEKKKIYAAYHTHTQGSMGAFDEAFALSKGNMANVDFGHFVAAGNVGGTPLQFLEKFHGRIASFHLKDRTSPAHCALNLPWGSGETPIGDILRMLRKNRWPIPATIEMEYAIPEGSDAVSEVRECLDYCRQALTV